MRGMRFVLMMFCLYGMQNGLHAADGSSADDAKWYTEPKVYSFRPRVDQARDFGPIGVTGIEATLKKGVAVTITAVHTPSPAAGKCVPGEIVLGVNGKALKGRNPFVALGEALTQAEATDGVLVFDLQRESGEVRQVRIEIPALGSYSKSFPLECRKSSAIVATAAEFYAAEMQKGDTCEIKGLEKSLVGLFLLSTGNDAYQPLIKHMFADAIADPASDGESTWLLGYRGILCAEYYLRTGDKSVLPVLQHYCEAARLGQRYNCSWAHNIYDTPTVYWLMNAAGTNILTTLLLAKECGVEVDDTTLRNALRFWYRFAGHGSVPYGDHRPGGGLGSDGKDGMAAAAMRIASHAQGDVTRFKLAHDWYTMSMADQYPGMITGHGDNGRGDAIWRGIALAGIKEIDPTRYRKEMDRHHWWLDLSRKASGGFRIAALQGFGDIGSGSVVGLFYTAPCKTLQITGAPRSPHAVDFTLPDFDWGTQADLAFMSTAPCPGYDELGPEEEIHLLNNRLHEPSSMRGKPFAGEELPLPYLLKYVRHRNIEVRIAAAKGLRHFGHFDELEKLLRDPDPRVRRAALDGILDWRSFFHMGKNRLTTEQYTPGILSAIHAIFANPEEAWWVIDGALFAMNAAPVDALKENLPYMIPWATSEEGYLREAASLGLLGAQRDQALLLEVLPTLTAMLQDPRKPNREWLNNLLADLLKEQQNNPKVVAMIRDGFIKAIRTTEVLPDKGLCRRQAEGLSMIMDSTKSAMQRSPEAAMALAQAIEPRLNEMTPDMLLGLVSAPNCYLGAKLRLGLHTLVGRQKTPQDREALADLLYNSYRPVLIKMMNTPDTQAQQRENLLLAVADICKLQGEDKGWQALGEPAAGAREWRYHTFNTTSKNTIAWSRTFILDQFTNAALPPGMEEWAMPEFDATAWQVAQCPIGKGSFEGMVKEGGRMNPIGLRYENRSAWPDEHEFLIMRTTVDLDLADLDYAVYRVGVLAGGCYALYINGKKLDAVLRPYDFPRYAGRQVKDLKELNFKQGRNTIAVIANHAFPENRSTEPMAQIDVAIQGLRESDFAMPPHRVD